MDNANYNTQDVKKCCDRKTDVEFRSGKEYNGWVTYENKKVSRITVSKGKKFIPPKTYKSMAKQLKLSVDEFDRFLDCSLTYREYKALLAKQINS